MKQNKLLSKTKYRYCDKKHYMVAEDICDKICKLGKNSYKKRWWKLCQKFKVVKR